MNYPSVQMSQVISAIVLGGKAVATTKIVETAKQSPKVPTQKFKIKQYETKTFELPELGSSNLYTITSQQSFQARIDGNNLIVEASNEQVGNYSMTLNTTVNTLISVQIEIFTIQEDQVSSKQSQQSQKITNEAAKATFFNGNLTDASSEVPIASTANSTANKTEDSEPAIMTLKKISNRGLLAIKFSKEVLLITNLTDFWIHAEIILKQSEDYSYKTSFTIHNMTNPLSLAIQLNFSAPLNVSASRIPDSLSVRFNTTLFTRANLLPVVYLNDSIDIPMQLSDNQYEEIIMNAVSGTVNGMNAVSGSTFATSMFVSFGLGEILGDIKGLTVICTLYCANMQYPALARQLGSTLLQFVQFDLFDCDPLYNQIFGDDETEPYTVNFGSAGYGSRQLVRIMGSLFVLSFITLAFTLLLRILLFVKFLPAPLRSKISDFLSKIYWNIVFGFIKQNYIMLVMGSLLNITNIEIAVPLKSSRRLGPDHSQSITGQKFLDFHAIFSILVFVACIAVPITLIALSYRNFEQLKDKTSPQSLTWGGQMKHIRIQRVFTAETGPAEWALNQSKLTKSQAILALSIGYVYEFLFVLVLLCLNNYPWAQLVILSFISLAQVMCFLYLVPFEDASKNRSEVASQVLILVFVLTMRCFTDWVSDTQARQYVAYVQIMLLLVFLLVVLLQILWKVLQKLKLIVNLISKICKRRQFLTDLAFVFRDTEFLRNCFQKMAKENQKEMLSKEKKIASEMVKVTRNSLPFRNISQLRIDSTADLIQVKTKKATQSASIVQEHKIYRFDLEQHNEDRQSLLARLRRLLELSEPKRIIIQVSFGKIQSYYRSELTIFREVNKKNMAEMLQVLTRVSQTRWPYGMAHIKEIELRLTDWTAFYDLNWEWLDCVPFDFYLMKREVQNLFVRDILLLQVSQAKPEVRRLERLIREREGAKIVRWDKYFQLKNFYQWHSEIDDFQEFFVGKYRERMETLNSALETWPVGRVSSFMEQVEEKRSKSDQIGYLEYLQNLHIVVMEIVTGSLE